MPLRSTVENRSSISSAVCSPAGRTSFTSSKSRNPRSLPRLIRLRSWSYFSRMTVDKSFLPVQLKPRPQIDRLRLRIDPCKPISGKSERRTMSLRIFGNFSRIEGLRSSRSMRVPVDIQLGFTDTVVCFQGTVRGRGQLAMEFKRANVRSILQAQTVGRKCFVHDREGDLVRVDR